MKTIELKKIVFVLFLFPIVACNDSFSQDVFWQGVNNTERKWEEQIHYAMTNKTRSGSGSLVLTSCEEKNTITSNVELEEAVELIFADDSNIAIQNPIDYSFVISQISNVSYDFTELKEEVLILGNEKLSEGKNLRLLELEWTYKDSTYSSRALVTDEDGILFETIGYFVAIKEKENSKATKRMKTRSENGNNNSWDNSWDGDSDDNSGNAPTDNPTSPSESSETKYFEKSDYSLNILFMKIYSYEITCSSTFNSKGVLTHRTTNAKSESIPGHQCSAEIRTISGTIDTDTYHEFAWGYQHGSNITISLSWNGMGYSVSGGGTSEVGSDIHRKG